VPKKHIFVKTKKNFYHWAPFKFMREKLLLALIFVCTSALAQNKYAGRVLDAGSRQPIIGANVIIKGTSQGAPTDIDGKFSFVSSTKPPFTMVVSSLGYTKKEFEITAVSDKLEFLLEPDNVFLKSIEIEDTRITQKQQEAPLTVESLDLIGIKETPSANFYEGLGSLKGVDVTSASLGFKVINTRGFNSTSPVRSLQLIDGVDNQSPGLNFSLGNFLGASELDIRKVDLVQGASSAFYGPNAFNGVIAMETKSPFDFTGLSISSKIGERNLFEGAARWAQKFQNKQGNDWFAYKLNVMAMRADDWEATNYDPATDSKVGVTNPGGYDAVNIYGDEAIAGKNDYYTSKGERRTLKGLGIFYRNGYREKDIVDYKTRNLKANAALHFMIKKKYELIAASNFSYGTTVYQGENRYSLRDIMFFQNRLEFRQKDKFFIRFYSTNEDAGNTYDAVVAANLLRDMSMPLDVYFTRYRNLWSQMGFLGQVNALPGMASGPPVSYDYHQHDAILNFYHSDVAGMHQALKDSLNNLTILNPDGSFFIQPFFEPGTERFDTAFAGVTSRLLGQGGARFYDRSALYHLHGEYKAHVWRRRLELTAGANFRLYAPDSKGTIFSDTAGTRIYNFEGGVYLGAELKLEKLKISLTNRVDKNINFPFLWSPALSFVYTPQREHTVRLSFSSGVRNPTLADQYLNYYVGRATLLGNLNGYDSLLTVESLRNYVQAPIKNFDTLQYFSVDPVRPERVWTAEVGYRGTLWKRLYVDFSAFYSFYQHFIGYKIGVFSDFDGQFNPVNVRAVRVATNSRDIVHTRGVSVQLSYFFKKYYTLSGNYTYNELDRRGSEDPLIPAFNTPRHKFNVGIGGRDIQMKIGKLKLNNWGFNINYKWIEGFLFEGSPQFTGSIPTYDMLDAQINYIWKKPHLTFKIGAQNLLNNKVYQVYGGPRVGRLAYFSIQFDMGDWGTGKNVGKNKNNHQ
jgi:outer membrane receptor protein involved in Fe transport